LLLKKGEARNSASICFYEKKEKFPTGKERGKCPAR